MSRPVVRRAGEGPWTKALLIGLAVLLAVALLGAPFILIFVRALSEGFAVYGEKLAEPSTLHAIWLTVLTSLVCVPINILFGMAAAWLIVRHRPPGRTLLTVLIELPVSISPIVAGVALLFLYGAQGLFGPWLLEHGIRLMFAVPAIFLASLFVTSPFVARQLITSLQSQGVEDEEAARSLGAGGFRTFLSITLPNVKGGLLYGAILTNARVMGEFGAVSVVSGKIRGETNTLPLQVELLFNDYNATGAFAAATVLAIVALATLVVKAILERGGVEKRG